MTQRFETIPFNPARWPFFYGYAIIALSMAGMLMSVPGQTMGVSAFTDSLIRDLDITRVNLTTAYMAGTIASSLILTWAGRMYDRLGARVMTLAAVAGLGTVLVSLSCADRLVGALRQIAPPGAGALVGLTVMGVGFFLLRFFGQGMLTMTSRNMLMQWFECRRGLANGISGVFTAFGFSLSPRFLDALIGSHGWQGTWRILGIAIGIGFGVFVLVFYRDTPEGCGLLPDGGSPGTGPGAQSREPERHFTLAEARRTYAFWIFIGALALLGLYYTAMTFHVASIFEEAGRDRATAFGIFLPASVISVVVCFAAGWASDRIKLKRLFMIMLGGTVLSMVGLCGLDKAWGIPVLIAGNGIAMGHFGILGGVTWPAFYGRRHLGEISGFNMAAMVFGSAIGPWLFSLSLAVTRSYRISILACMGVALLLLAGAIRADRPRPLEPEPPPCPDEPNPVS